MMNLTTAFGKASAAWTWFTREFLKVTILRVVIAAVMFAGASAFVNAGSKKYYADFIMPPSFRHVDYLERETFMRNYIDAQNLGPDDIVVLGDCVSFGHGVDLSYPAFINVEGKRIVNISMQSFNYNFMALTLDAAAEKGVKHFIIQLHPFEYYKFDEKAWRTLTSSNPATVKQGQSEWVEQTKVNWRQQNIGNIQGMFETGLFKDYKPWRNFSGVLRYDIRGKWKLFANRFAYDDWSGIDKSFYTSRTTRRRNFKVPLSRERQRKIIAKKTSFWEYFILNDKPAFIESAKNHSPTKRMSAMLNERGLTATFLMVPTFVDFLTETTELTAEDMRAATQIYKDIAESHGHKFINLLDDPDLIPHMYHYDNLTFDGHMVMGKKLTNLLAGEYN